MKSIVSFFNDFLRDEVNLNPTRLKIAKKGIKTIGKFLKRNELFKGKIKEVTPQGSYRQGTINKPFDDSDFDVDLLVLLDEFDDWQPKDYLNRLHQEFKCTERYKDIVDRKGKSRCVTIDYESDFHIDIVPAIKKNGKYKIMNKNSNEFEDTDGDGYAQWFEEKNSITSNNFLTKTVRLVKYLRDFKQTFSIKSILLTTLLGRQVNEFDKYYQNSLYKDLPTTLKTLFNRLDSYLQARPFLIDEIITNPILPDEKFNRHWDQDKYFNFRSKVHDYNIWINEAYEEENINESVNKWRKIFGDAFGEIQETISSFSASSRIDSQEYQEEFINEFYTEDLDNNWKLVISVIPHQSRGGFRPLYYRKKESLIFFVDRDKSFLPEDVAFRWKVKNSGIEAKSHKQLRGNIENDLNDNGVKEEKTEYKGKHYVECYALSKNTVIATDIIYVNII
jgi:hypothetical protein